MAGRRLRIGYVAPDLAFYNELTVAENLRFFARLRRVDPTRGFEVLDRLSLPTDRMAGALSSGMRQRLRWAWGPCSTGRASCSSTSRSRTSTPRARKAPAPSSPSTSPRPPGGLAVIANPSALEIDRVTARLDLGR